MKQQREEPLFPEYLEDELLQQKQQEQQRVHEQNISGLSCGTSYNPDAALLNLGLSRDLWEQQQLLLQQQKPQLLLEIEAEEAKKEKIRIAEAALVSGEVDLERDEREHRRQFKLLQQQQQEQDEETAYKIYKERRRRKQQQQKQQQDHAQQLALSEAARQNSSSCC
ncbi:hypothetical protein EPH_0072810 [Eimeria praecox]|uniref:Uncharacterized protein n=1 Tax=Eimeria praecox TaxID=51316 RepID=U6H6E5_9EIME|nr:hypothetical protein EPH_0072810 [Eimeria praecox]